LDSYWEIRFGLVLSDSQLNNSVKLLVSINMAETCEQLSSWQSAVCLLQISAATSLPLPQTYANIQMTNIFQAHLYKLCPCTCADKSFFTRFKFHFSTVYSRHLWRGILVYSPKGGIQLRNKFVQYTVNIKHRKTQVLLTATRKYETVRWCNNDHDDPSQHDILLLIWHSSHK